MAVAPTAAQAAVRRKSRRVGWMRAMVFASEKREPHSLSPEYREEGVSFIYRCAANWADVTIRCAAVRARSSVCADVGGVDSVVAFTSVVMRLFISGVIAFAISSRF